MNQKLCNPALMLADVLVVVFKTITTQPPPVPLQHANEPLYPMMSANAKLGTVVAVHVAVGWLLSLAAQRTLGHFSLPLFALLALTFADAGLLGIWAGLSQTRLAWRVAALAVGLPYLWAVYAIAFQVPCQGGVQFAMIAQPSVAISLVLHTLQASRRLRLEHLPLTPLAGRQ